MGGLALVWKNGSEHEENVSFHQAFNEGNCEDAINHWNRGVRSCKTILSRNAYEGEKKKEIEDLLCTLNCNLAIGLLKLGVRTNGKRKTHI